jgi:hypothetical protein
VPLQAWAEHHRAHFTPYSGTGAGDSGLRFCVIAADCQRRPPGNGARHLKACPMRSLTVSSAVPVHRACNAPREQHRTTPRGRHAFGDPRKHVLGQCTLTTTGP